MKLQSATALPRRALGFARRTRVFLRDEIWHLQARQVQRHWWAVRVYRFFGSVIFAFRMNRFALHASALTYYTLLSVVPVLALALTLARAFGGDDMARTHALNFLDKWLGRLQPVAAEEAAHNAEAAVNPNAEALQNLAAQLQEIVAGLFDQISQFSFKTLGGVGAVALVWMVVTMLSRVEESFNMIWGIKQTRPMRRKFFDYLGVVILLPFLLIAGASVPILELATRTAGNVAFLGPYMLAVVHAVWMRHLLTVVAVTLGFTFIIVFMPNTRVKFLPGLAGGFATGLLFMAWLVVCARLQIGIVKYSALYGGFAMLPILLFWIYASWLIVLLGAEVTFALQNGDTCHVDFQRGASARARLLLCMALCREAGLRVKNLSAPLDPVEFALRHGISVRLAMHTVDTLVHHKWLAKVDNHGEAYLPCRDFSTLRLADFARWIFNEGYSLRTLGLEELDTGLLDAGDRIDAALERELQTPLV